MIKEIQKTFEYLPREAGEEYRNLFIMTHPFAGTLVLRMGIIIRGETHGVSHQFTTMELQESNTPIERIEDHVLQELCYKLHQHLTSVSMPNPVVAPHVIRD